MNPAEVKLKRKILGVVIRKARKRAGKTIKECAQALGISPRSFASIEKGARDLSLPQLEILARFLGISPRKLWNGEVPDLDSELKLPSEEAVKVRDKIIGLLLKEAREEAGKSLKESAKAIGVSTRTLKAYEMGQKPVPLIHLEALADFYGVEKEHFLQQSLFGDEELSLEEEYKRFRELPPEIRKFVIKPANVLYLRSAMALSRMSADEIRRLAESLLDITY